MMDLKEEIKIIKDRDKQEIMNLIKEKYHQFIINIEIERKKELSYFYTVNFKQGITMVFFVTHEELEGEIKQVVIYNTNDSFPDIFSENLKENINNILTKHIVFEPIFDYPFVEIKKCEYEDNRTMVININNVECIEEITNNKYSIRFEKNYYITDEDGYDLIIKMIKKGE